VALPALDEAVKKVKAIEVSAFYELKKMASPSMSCVKIFEVVCVFF